MRRAELYAALSNGGVVPREYTAVAVMKYMGWDYFQYRRCPLSVLHKIGDWMEAEAMMEKARNA